MKEVLIALVLKACLLSECSHYFSSLYGARNHLQSIACKAFPPNKPG